MLPPKLVLLSLLLAALPLASAHHGCDVELEFCLGGMYHEEGEGDCPGDSREAYLVTGYEGQQTGSYLLAGAGWMCDEHELRQGVFVEGGPVPAFVGVYETETHCGVEAGATVFVTYEQAQNEQALTCMLM